MKKNKYILQIAVFALIIISFIACEDEFTTLNSDIITTDNATSFNIIKESFPVIAYTKVLEPVQTNNLGLNSLGIYKDAYGGTTSSFVTQLNLSTYDPDFGEGVEIDSVVLTLPFFNSVTEVDDDGNITYDIDSILPSSSSDAYNPIKLSLFESNYFLRNFDPNSEFNEIQNYFSDKSASTTEPISEMILEGQELTMLVAPETSHTGSNTINISKEGFVLEEDDEDGVAQVSQRLEPGIRVKLDPTFWKTKIIDQEGNTELSNVTNFSEYFRGLYFKAEAIGGEGSFVVLNPSATTANITIYYTRLNETTTDETTDTEQATFAINFGPNRVNFMANDFTSIPLLDGDAATGDSRLYLKGGEGAYGRIKLFNGDDIDEEADTTFEDWKEFFVETDAEGNFVKSKRLVNEANLVFYVDQTLMLDPNNEPNRLFLYDINNETPIIDYFLDDFFDSFPEVSVGNHLGILERIDDDPTNTKSGIKYKMRITEHINNLLLRDSTNVELGLVPSLNINLEQQTLQPVVQTSDDTEAHIPLSSILTPRGTVLHGSNSEDESKKVELEIFYTDPDN